MKKKLKINLLTVTFVFLSVILLYFVRITASRLITSLRSYVPELNRIQEDLLTSNLTAAADMNVITNAENLALYSMVLYLAVLPLGIYLLFIIFEGYVWKELRKISWKRIFLLGFFVMVLLFSFTVTLLDYLSYIFFGTGYADNFIMIFVSVAVLVISYFVFTGFSKDYNLRNTLVYGLNNLKKSWFWYVLFSVCSFILFILTGLMYVFVVLDYTLIFLGAVTLIFVFLVNSLRIKLFNILK